MDYISVVEKLKSCCGAALKVRSSKTEIKNQVLLTSARLLSEQSALLLVANARDVSALKPDATKAFKDRLYLDEGRIRGMVESLKQVAALADPVGELVEKKILKNGLKVRKVRAPLGVILMIFESRPNVAVEAFSLAFKAGNVLILRGGKESVHTTSEIYRILNQALTMHLMPEDSVWGIIDTDRALTRFLLEQHRFIDVVVPRGGTSLIEFVTTHTRIPVIKNDRGLCHIYVHHDAPEKIALTLIENAKTQRPGVCNSMETLLIHEGIYKKFLPLVYDRLSQYSVQWYVCPRAATLLAGKNGIHSAVLTSFDTEYLDLKMNCRVVDSLEQAIAHIDAHGSKHSECIVTASQETALLFQDQVDAAAVYWNASTRFTDGFELGLGGELGISTQKLHVRGPVGLKELTSVRWLIDGEGQTR